MSEPVDDFLMHYGVKGMKWGKRRISDDSGDPKPKMSREKKVAIAVGVAATVAVGAAIAFGIMDKKANDGAGFSFGELPVQTLTTNKTMMAGKANLIFSAAAMQQPVPPAPKRSLVEQVKVKGFDTAKSVAIKKIQSTTYDDLKSLGTNPPRSGFKEKTTGFVKDRTNEVIIRKIANASSAKVKQIDESKKKR
ncbi:hypothetical protein PBI_INGRID_9 [Arthrobacter phage Ingrid]|nr:hypothetical protein PBI_INGRID_9 [Arthrobacter phage Ingrid]QFG10991.1 hypothetical protein PBI_LORETTA_9 [Arthrobacter phage Loretta]